MPTSPENPAPHQLDRVKLVLSLSRANVRKFGDMEWGALAGAMGDAHVVEFHQPDDDSLREQLGLQHWPKDSTIVVLDDGGLTWNLMSPLNGYAFQVCVSLDVDCYEPGNPDEFWRVEFAGPPALEARVAALPEHQRRLVMSCPYEARALVLCGLANSPSAPPDARVEELRAAVRALESVDMSGWPGLYDRIPWNSLESAVTNQPLPPDPAAGSK